MDDGASAVKMHVEGSSWCQKLEFWTLFLMRRVAGRLAKPLCHEAEICLAQEGRGLRRPCGWRRVGRQNACRGELLVPKARVLDALSNAQGGSTIGKAVAP